MNKTITINLSGIVFHIDENAYEQLKKYLEKLKLHFNATHGSDEIIADIESRIAEMFTAKNSDSKNVISLDDVDAVIQQMGNPEEMTGEEQPGAKKFASEPFAGEKIKRRFFRNPDDKILGGVCSGISAYFDIDPIWLRLAFALTVIFAGTGILIYIILWIIIPPARTTSEKLEMRGENVNVSTIEKNVREELGNVKERLEDIGKKLSSQETIQRVETYGKKTGDFLRDVFTNLFAFIGKLIGLFIVIISISVLIALTMGLFTSIGMFSFIIPSAMTQMVLTQWQLIWMITGLILLIGIPFTMLLLNGIKLLFKANLNLKKIGVLSLFFWLIGVSICIINCVSIRQEYIDSATIKKEVTIKSINSHRINLSLLPGDEGWREGRHNYGPFSETFIMNNGNSDSLFIHDVEFNIEQSDDDSIKLEIFSHSRGSSTVMARQLASSIQYNYSIQDSVLRLSPLFILPTSEKYRGQSIRLVLLLPVGKSVYLAQNMRNIIYDIPNVSNTWDEDMVGHEWKMTKDGLQCTDSSNIIDTRPKRHGYHQHISIPL